MADYTNCRIQFIDDMTEMDVTIKSNETIIEEEDDEIFYYGPSRNTLLKAQRTGAILGGEFRVLEVY